MTAACLNSPISISALSSLDLLMQSLQREYFFLQNSQMFLNTIVRPRLSIQQHCYSSPLPALDADPSIERCPSKEQAITTRVNLRVIVTQTASQVSGYKPIMVDIYEWMNGKMNIGKICVTSKNWLEQQLSHIKQLD